VRCVILTVCNCADTAVTAINAGADGYILKGIGARELEAALWTVYNKSLFISPDFSRRVLLAAQRSDVTSLAAKSGLTHRELQIMQEVERGQTNRMVAEKLKLSEKTVKYYMTNIMQKFGVRNRVAAVIEHKKMCEQLLTR
jgi:DNA-binding NarL/FixJ family response regulator